ncbi:MAG: hypothetical protein IKR07_01320 [Oscillospiraceae bacterium]|nr:hypothetical protein [Oscillospiraceae bacterium]
MNVPYAQSCGAAAIGGSASSFAPSYADSLPGTDAVSASVLFIFPALPSALPVPGLLRRAGAGKNTVD